MAAVTHAQRGNARENAGGLGAGMEMKVVREAQVERAQWPDARSIGIACPVEWRPWRRKGVRRTEYAAVDARLVGEQEMKNWYKERYVVTCPACLLHTSICGSQWFVIHVW